MVQHKTIKACLVVSVLLLPAPAWADYHIGWFVNEVYTNASGTNQFVELFNPVDVGQGFFTPGTGQASLFSTANQFDFPSDLPDPINTNGKHVLIGTVGFAALSGAPTPDYTLPDNFFSVSGDTIEFGDKPGFNPFGIIDFLTFASIPTNGINSLDIDGLVIVNSPTNFAGDTGSVAPPAPPSFDIPEPSTFTLLVLALFGLRVMKRRKR